jgi:WD40 repeat protein
MPLPDDHAPDPPPPPDLSAAGLADLSRLLGGLDLLDQLLRLPTAPDEEGDVPLGRYRARRRIGAGRFGVVFLADDPGLHRRVVVKVPQAAVLADPDLRERFAREATAAGRLDHPGVVPVYESGEHGGLVYLVAAFVEGPTLAAWLSTRPGPPAPHLAARLVRMLALAVAHAHDRGVLHCDLTPNNVLLGPTEAPPLGVPGVGSPRVTDFGLARLSEGHYAERLPRAGTPLYLAPEQGAVDGQEITQRTDVYGLGVILYELLSGRPPFGGGGSTEIVRSAVSEEPPTPSRHRSGLPRDVEAVCLKCLRKDPAERYPTAAALADDLDRFLAHEPVSARQYGWSERASLWVRRRPEAFALIILLVALGAVIAGNALREVERVRAHNLELSGALDREREESRLRREAVERERAAAAALRAQHYAAGVADAGSLAEAGRTDLLRPLLMELEPGPGEVDRREFAWHYLSNLTPERLRLKGHHTSVKEVAASPDGRHFASVSRDGEVILWDPAAGRRGKSLGRLPGHFTNSSHFGAAFSPDGRLAAFATDWDSGGVLRVWEVASGQLLGERAEKGVSFVAAAVPAGEGPVEYLRQSPDGLELVRWDVPAGGTAVHWRGPRGEPVFTARLGPGGAVAVSRWGPERGKPTASVECWGPGPKTGGPAVAARGVHDSRIALSHDGALLAFAPDGQPLRVVDAKTGRELFRGRQGFTGAPALAFSPDGKALAVLTPSPDQTIELWDVPAGRRERVTRLAVGAGAAAFAPDGALAVGYADGSLGFWDPRRPAPGRELGRHEGEVWSVAFAPDGKSVASAGDDHAIRLWDARTGGRRASLAGHESLVMSVAFTPDGGRLLSGGYDGTVRLWDLATGVGRVLEPAHAAPASGVAVGPDGRTAASRGRDGVLRLWDLAAGRRLRDDPCDAGKVGAVAFSPDGRALALAAGSDGVRCRDVATGEPGWGHASPDYVWSVAYSPGGETVALGNANGEVRLWGVGAPAPRAVLVGHEGGVRSVAFSPDGRTLATGSDDRTVRLWHAETGRELLTLRGHAGKVFSVAFSPDGKSLVSGSHDNTIRIWQAED